MVVSRPGQLYCQADMVIIISSVWPSKLYQLVPFWNYLETIVIRETATGVGSAYHEGIQMSW